MQKPCGLLMIWNSLSFLLADPSLLYLFDSSVGQISTEDVALRLLITPPVLLLFSFTAPV